MKRDDPAAVDREAAADAAGRLQPEADRAEISTRADGDPTAFGALLRAAVATPVVAPDALIGVGQELMDGRFHIEARIGQGGMGVVYRAFDRERAASVALKTIQGAYAADGARLKAEFRALADVTHPNLLTLHELCSDGARWFFTMELVDGQDLVRHLRGVPSSELPTVVAARKRLALSGGAADDGLRLQSGLPDLQRLRDVFSQLIDAVSAIHAAAKLHRDLKPSNVLVDRRGRVVVLDYGLVVSHMRRDAERRTGGEIAGTPAYMAPEQLSGEPIGAGSDWYAVGCMLYEAISGRLPFSGAPLAILRAKQLGTPPPIAALVPDVPHALAELCMALLSASPLARPTPERMRALLGGAARVRSGVPRALSRPPSDGVFVGRTDELAQLRAGFELAARGQTAACLVHGASGNGKSRLIEQLLRQLEAEDTALVLRARCYERESVPFKAFDTVADALCAHLSALPAAQRAQLLPTDMSALARVFPVFERLLEGRPVPGLHDAHELRFRAFSNLKQLLHTLSKRRPLVLHVDDLQWGDVDGAELLMELLQPPDAPFLYFIGSYRSDDHAQSPFLRRLSTMRAGASVVLQEIALAPLDGALSAELAAQLLVGRGIGSTTAQQIALESGGSPLFIADLVEHWRAYGAHTPAAVWSAPTLLQVMELRLAGLAPSERRLLEVIALAARPLAQRLALEAAGLSTTDSILGLLRAERMIRTQGARAGDSVECYHDRIRELLSARLPPQRARELHLALAQALEKDDPSHAEMIAEHYLNAGLPVRAAPFAVRAADAAAAAFAFDRAARLYGLALELNQGGAEAQRLLLRKQGQALVNVGRGTDAAEVFLEAARGAARSEALEIERLAAAQLLNAGHYERGRALLRQVVQGFGLPYPERPSQLLAGLAMRALRLKLRGFRPPLSAPYSSPHERQLLQVCWSAAFSSWIFDPLRFAFYALEFALRSVEIGDADAMAKARAIYGLSLVLRGPGQRAAALAHVAQARALTRDPYALAYIKLTEAGIHSEAYAHAESLRAADEAVCMLSDGCTGVTFELTLARAYGFVALTALGDFPELRRRLGPFGREMARRDLFAELQAATFNGVATLMEDGDMDAACSRMRAIMTRLPAAAQKDYITATITIELYAGHVATAWEKIRDLERDLGRFNGGFPIYSTRIEYQLRRGQCALVLARSARGGGRRAAVRAVRASIKQLLAAGSGVASAYAALLRAGLADTCADETSTVSALRKTEALFDTCHMPAYAAVARFRLGELGDVRAAEHARRFFEQRGVKNPRRLCGMYGLGPRAP